MYTIIIWLSCIRLLVSLRHENLTQVDLEVSITAAIKDITEDNKLLSLCTSRNKYGLPLPRTACWSPGHATPSCFICMLMLCGDIQPNPGPLPQQQGHRNASFFPCGYCELGVSWQHKAVCCEDCSVWYHNSCIELCTTDYENLQRSDVDWICVKCHSHNMTNSLFNAFELNTSNYYHPLLC